MAKQKKTKSQNWIGIVGIIAIAVLVVTVLIYVNNPNVFSDTSKIGPDPAIERSINENGHHTLGDLDAPITLVLYEDFGCPNCKRFFVNSESRLLSEYVATGLVRLEVYTIAIINTYSLPGAEATFCAADQGFFWEYRQVLFVNQGQRAFDRKTFELIGEAVGLDTADLLTCIEHQTHRQRVIDDSLVAQQFGVQGTPTFEVSGKRYPGPGEIELPDIFVILDELLLEVNN